IVIGLNIRRLDFVTWINGHAILMLIHADAKAPQFRTGGPDTIRLLEAGRGNPANSGRRRCKGSNNRKSLSSIGNVAHVYVNTCKISPACDFDGIPGLVNYASYWPKK